MFGHIFSLPGRHSYMVRNTPDKVAPHSSQALLRVDASAVGPLFYDNHVRLLCAKRDDG